jgi:TRAP-type mannitol/chloroaromatic compound transport system substrate-binding protein
MNAQGMAAWFHGGAGEGLKLWEETYAPFNLVPRPGGYTGVQMGGWFNKKINTIDDYKGLKMRIPGLGGKVVAKAGGTVVLTPGGEIFTSLERGVIDATEWVGPYHDLRMGFYQAAKYYYYPGWHEPGSMLEFIVNKNSLEALPADLQAIVTYAARAANQDMLDEFTARNNNALQDLINNKGVQLRKFPDDVIVRLHQSSEEVLADLAAGDAMAGKVYASYKSFLDNVTRYHHISEQAYINARDLKDSR